MPQPPEVEASARRLVAMFADAQHSIDAQLRAVLDAPGQTRRRRRLRELAAMVDRETRALEAGTAEWIAGDFPAVYELGAGHAQTGDFAWSQVHRDAVQALAGDLFDDVLAATTHVRVDVKRWVRRTGRRETALSLIEGRTATQAARVFTAAASAGDAVEALGGPVGVVQYADGSYRTLADYADMLLRTKTAQCFNAGTLNQLHSFGVRYVEVLDGTGCGWTSHVDGDRANGSIRRLQDAVEHPLSHPRCRRSFLGRPDITNRQQAREAGPSTASAQREDQTQTEKDRAERIGRARAARQRTPRLTAGARQPRVARQPRTPRAARAGTPAAVRPTSTGGVPARAAALEDGTPSIAGLLDTNPGSAELTEALRPVFDQDVGDLHARIEKAHIGRPGRSIYVDGAVLDADGARVGKFSRTLNRDPDGTLTVYNALLSLDGRAQGAGFATEYLAHLEGWYRANGVSHIDVHADIDVGGYTWAGKGFIWQQRPDNSPDFGNVPDRLRAAIRVAGDTPLAGEARALLERLEDPGTWWTARMVTPADVAQLGRAATDSMWFGKQVMLGSNWHGRKYL